MLRLKASHLILTLGLVAPVSSYAADYCIAVNGGFGNGGTSFVGKGFVVPAAGNCKPWSGFLKTATTVIATSTGTGCRSTNGQVLTFTIFSTDPPFFGPSEFALDHIQLCPAGIANCPIGGGSDVGTFGGSAAPQTCTTSLVRLPAVHD
jgi:hypothetical protein